MLYTAVIVVVESLPAQVSPGFESASVVRRRSLAIE